MQVHNVRKERKFITAILESMKASDLTSKKKVVIATQATLYNAHHSS